MRSLTALLLLMGLAAGADGLMDTYGMAGFALAGAAVVIAAAALVLTDSRRAR